MRVKIALLLFLLLTFVLGFTVGCAPDESTPTTSSITFNSNGGSAVPELVLDAGAEITAPAAPTKIGHTFECWCSDAALEQPFTFDKMPSKSVTLYAKYKVNAYSVAFELNGGAMTDTAPESYVYGTTLNLPVPTYTGFTFGGWFDNATLQGSAVESISATDLGNKTYYAKWTPASYTITYVLNELTNSPNNPTSYVFGSIVTLEDAISVADGVGFGGWYDNPEFNGDPITVIDQTRHEPLVLYAREKQGVYAVRYDVDGGKNDARNLTYYDSSVETPLYDAAKEYYRFLGWFDGNGTQYTEIPVAHTGALELTAKWTAIEYEINYVTDGGVIENAVETYSIETDKTQLPAPLKTGYAFLEWRDGNGKVVTTYGGGTTGDVNVTAYYKAASGVQIETDGVITKFTASENGAIVIPDNAVKIVDHVGYDPALEPKSLFIGPASRLEYIGNFAFINKTSFENCTIDLPACLKYIGNYAFLNVKFDFTLPETNALEFIGNAALEGTVWESRVSKPSQEPYVYFGKVLLKYKGDDVVVNGIRSDTVGIAGGAFQDKTTITQIVIPASVRTLGDSVFKNCTGITSITIPETVTMVFYDLFWGWTNQQTVCLPFAEGNKPAAWDDAWHVGTNAKFLYAKYAVEYDLDGGVNPTDAQNYYVRGEAYTLPVPEKDSFEFLGWYLTDDFSGDPITAIPATQIGAVTVYASWNMLELKQYTIVLDAGTGTLTTTEFVYDVNTEKTALPYPMKAGYAFEKWVDGEGNEVVSYGGGTTGDKSLTAVYKFGEGYTLNEYNEIIGWVTTDSGKVTIADDVTKILGHTANRDTATTYETEFFIGKNSQLTYIGDNAMAYMKFKNSRFDMPKTVTYIGTYAFINCNFFIDFDEDLSALGYIGAAAFEGTAWYAQQLPNYSDNDVYLGNVYYLNRNSVAGVCTIKDGTVAIAGGAFMRATQVTGVELPASLTTIGNNAFGDVWGTYASGITEITIPETVTTVGDSPFGSWKDTQTVYVPFAEGAKPDGWSQHYKSDTAAKFVYAQQTTD